MEKTKYEQLEDAVKALEPDFIKFYEKGVSAAGTRVRTGLQRLKKLANEIRTDVQTIRTEAKKPA